MNSAGIHPVNLTARQRLILAAVLADCRLLAEGAGAADLASMPSARRGRFVLAVARARRGLVRPNVDSWLGRTPTASERVLFSRDYRRLEAMGLLERVNERNGRRTTHLRLTEAGRRLAERLLSPDVVGGLDEDAFSASADA
jgi:DNA-binding HxlR family transcriptional regulator